MDLDQADGTNCWIKEVKLRSLEVQIQTKKSGKTGLINLFHGVITHSLYP